MFRVGGGRRGANRRPLRRAGRGLVPGASPDLPWNHQRQTRCSGPCHRGNVTEAGNKPSDLRFCLLNLHHGVSSGPVQLARLAADLKERSVSTPLVVFAHVPLWTIYEPWGWGTGDTDQLMDQLRHFGSVMVLNGRVAASSRCTGSNQSRMPGRIDAWRSDYIEHRPHRSLEGPTPREFALQSGS
jgi:hypothetical protein